MMTVIWEFIESMSNVANGKIEICLKIEITNYQITYNKDEPLKM